MKYCVIFVTCPDKKTAKKLSKILLEKKVAACISIFPVESIYWWEGKLEKSREHLLLIKTKLSLFKKIKQTIEENHPYSVPEILCIKVEKGNEKYLAWMGEVL